MIGMQSPAFLPSGVSGGFVTLDPPNEKRELNVISSGACLAALEDLALRFSKDSGQRVNVIFGPSMGKSPEAIPARLKRGEHADVVVMAGYALDELVTEGYIIPSSRFDLADSSIGVVVRRGTCCPDISTVDGLRRALLDAKSIAYSDSASGVYVERNLFKCLGVEAEVKAKARMIQKIPVASVVADGSYELGLQQVSELLPIAGVVYVGRLPEEVQCVTRFAAGIPVTAPHPEEMANLFGYLASPDARSLLCSFGLDAPTALTDRETDFGMKPRPFLWKDFRRGAEPQAVAPA